MLEMQSVDLEIMQAKKKRAELPQRIKVMVLRKKRAEIEGKLEQVLALQEKAESEFRVLEDEDTQLAEKQQRAQEIIDASGSDYRKVESHSKEMAGTAKRRETLSELMLAKSAELDKIKAVHKQIHDAIAASQAEEDRIRASFEAEDKGLVNTVSELTARHDELAGTLPAKLADLYQRTAAKSGGVAVGRLVEGQCGVCRAQIDGGRLIELQAQAPLGVCPNCKRLLVIE